MKRTVLCSLLIAMTLNVMAQKKITQTAGRTQLGEFLPSLNTSTMTSFSARCVKWQDGKLLNGAKEKSLKAWLETLE